MGVTSDNLPDAAQVLAHYAWPCIKYNKHWCYFCPWSVASGDFKTLEGNTRRHMVGYQKLSYDIQVHGILENCKGCYLCGGDSDFYIGDEELSRIVGGVFLGDDRLRRHSEYPVARWIDHVLGTKTKAEHKNAFFEQGNAAEFCKVSFGKNLETYREPMRVFAKLYNGVATEYDDVFCCALQSASLELGPSKRAQKVLQAIYDRVAEGIEYNDDLQKQEGLIEGEPLRPFSVSEVKVLQAGGDGCLLETAAEWWSVM